MAAGAGNNQSALEGTVVAIPPAVVVTDRFGNPVGGVGSPSPSRRAAGASPARRRRQRRRHRHRRKLDPRDDPRREHADRDGHGSGITGNPVTFTATATGATGALTISPTALPTATYGSPYQGANGLQFGASGGVPPYGWTETGGLPQGMTLSSTGQLYGAPTATGSFPIVVQVKDHTTPTPLTASEPLTLVVNPALVFTTNATLPGAAVNAAYSQTIAAAGGVSPYGFTVATGSTLPSGLTLAAGGLLSGTPTTAGAYAFTLQVTDATTPTPNVTTELFTLVVKAPLTISPTALPGATQNAVYQGLGLQFTATGGTGPYTWTETGTLPSTMSLQSNGLLRGNPQTSRSFPITVQVTDADHPHAADREPAAHPHRRSGARVHVDVAASGRHRRCGV